MSTAERLTRVMRRLTPGVLKNLEALKGLTRDYEADPIRFVVYERELATLRREIDEVRRDQMRVQSLYDLVFAEFARGTDEEGAEVRVRALDGKIAEILARNGTRESQSTAP